MAKLAKLKKAVEFIEHPAAGGILLLSCVIISLILANSPAQTGFTNLLGVKVGGELFGPDFTLTTFINDGLMAIFFLMAGLEIKREIVEGQLSKIKNATLPVLSAVGGMLFPALIYVVFNYNAKTSTGWGIPMATDIAFAVAILNALRKFVPDGLRVSLTALAIVDDLGAIIVIAIFYTHDLHIEYLYYSAGIYGIMLLMNYFDFKGLWYYLIPGIIMWVFIHHSGIHSTVAGVLTAFAIPMRTKSGYSPVCVLEHKLSNMVNFLILPVFALVNTNITYETGMLKALTSPLGLGVILGLVIGKPAGIFLMSWAAVKTKLSVLPDGINWIHIAGMGMLAGIGFTMSIFISLLSFDDYILQSEAKFAILIASVIAAVIGFVSLRAYSKRANGNGSE